MEQNKKRIRHGRGHHGDDAASFTTHEVVGKHGDDYKSLFQAFISSDVICEKLSVSEILGSIKAFALNKRIVTTSFDIEMNIKCIAKLLLTASLQPSSRVTKHEDNSWSILNRVEPISKHNVITSKKYLTTLRRQSKESTELKVFSPLFKLCCRHSPQIICG